MKIFVERVIEETFAEEVALPRLASKVTHTVIGESGVHVTAVLRAVVESADDAQLWKESVGRTLQVLAPQ